MNTSVSPINGTTTGSTDFITLYDNTNMTDVTNGNVTTSKPAPARGGAPPLGYYGETRIQIWKIVPPIIIVWGIIGNLLTIIVLSKQMRKKLTSTSVYLVTLAASDSIILLCGPLRNFILFNWDDDIRNLSDVGCRIQLYFTYATIQFSSWLLVAVTVERCISVILPHKVRLGCTPKIAAALIVVIFLCVFGLNVCIPVTHSRFPFGSSRFKCAPTTENYQEFRDDIWHWIDFIMAFAVPFLLLLIGNIIIIAHLCKSRKKQKQMMVSNSSSSKMKSVSVLLVLLCFVFLTTMTPVSVFLIYYPYRYEEVVNMPTYAEAFAAYQHLLYQHAIVNVVGYTNASFNFIMYVLSGPKFRHEFTSLLCCLCKRVDKQSRTSQTKSTSLATTDASGRSKTNGGFTDSTRSCEAVSETPNGSNPTDVPIVDKKQNDDNELNNENDNKNNLAHELNEKNQHKNGDINGIVVCIVEPDKEHEKSNGKVNNLYHVNTKENGDKEEPKLHSIEKYQEKEIEANPTLGIDTSQVKEENKDEIVTIVVSTEPDISSANENYTNLAYEQADIQESEKQDN